MSGTAPSDPAPSIHASDRGIEQTPLDSNQHGQAQNIIEETKDTYGQTVDRNIGEHIDASKVQGELTARADGLLNEHSAGNGSNANQNRKGETTTEHGFKIGEDADLHDLAKNKQP